MMVLLIRMPPTLSVIAAINERVVCVVVCLVPANIFVCTYTVLVWREDSAAMKASSLLTLTGLI